MKGGARMGGQSRMIEILRIVFEHGPIRAPDILNKLTSRVAEGTLYSDISRLREKLWRFHGVTITSGMGRNPVGYYLEPVAKKHVGELLEKGEI